jgi:hypothetical protein
MPHRLPHLLIILSVVVSTFMHAPHLPKDLVSIHVWRQTQTQSTIDNFYEEDMNIVNPRKNDRGNGDGIFRMEFPLMQWMIAMLYKIFGSHLIITRLFLFLTGIIAIIGLYQLLLALFSHSLAAAAGAWTFCFSPAFFYYTINPLPDLFALCFGIWGLALFFRYVQNNKTTLLLLSGFFIAISGLCKLPFILLYAVPVTYFIQQFIRTKFSTQEFPVWIATFAWVALPAAWYVTVIPTWHGNVIVKGILDNQDSVQRLLHYLNHNLISTLPELLVGYGAMLFFITGIIFTFRNNVHRNRLFWPIASWLILFLAYYIFEANAIGTVHDYYLFPIIPLLFIVVSYGMMQLLKFHNSVSRILIPLLLLIIPITCYLRMQSRWNVDSPGFNKDLLVYKNELQHIVPDDAVVIAGNDESHFIWFYYLHKKGWAFYPEPDTAQLHEMINKGAQFLYTDSEKIKTQQEFQPFLSEEVGKFGSITVFALSKR